jgi:hypothetical protein
MSAAIITFIKNSPIIRHNHKTREKGKQLTFTKTYMTIQILIYNNIFYKEHAIIVMIMLCMFILGGRFIKAIIACF